MGVKVLMLNLDQKTAEAGDGTPIYGIKKLFVYRPGTPISLQSDEAQEGNTKLMNRWKLMDVEYINIAFKVPYLLAEDYMNEQYDDSITNIRTFMEMSPQFSEVLNRAEKIKEVIGTLTGKLGQMAKSLETI